MFAVDFARTMIPSDLHGVYILLCCYAITILLSFFGIAIYRIYFHPLANFPGPKLAAVSRLPYARWSLAGTVPFVVSDLHDRYGDVVRIAPDELTYRDAQAWKDIYGQHAPKTKNFEKDLRSYSPPTNGTDGLLTSNPEVHRRQRNILSNAFSDRALRDQEPAIKGFTDLLISRLYSQVDGAARGVVDVTKWYNYTTFDMIGDFAFGESFNCLKDNQYHPWVAVVFSAIKSSRLMTIARRFPRIAPIVRLLFIPKDLIEKRCQSYFMSTEKVRRRLEEKTNRTDLITFMLRENPHREPLTRSEIETNSEQIIIAGSETTATLLSGATFHLLKNPETYRKLTQEIRSSFGSSEEIGLDSTKELPYLHAVIQESLRLYPPVVAGLARKVPEGGAIVSNRFVPENTAVSVTFWSANRSGSNWAEAKSFIPERWLDQDSRFAHDKRDAMQPFSMGPRNCIGKSSAYAKTRLILSKVLYHFDLELRSDSAQWADQKVYLVWEKSPLMVKLVPVRPQ